MRGRNGHGAVNLAIKAALLLGRYRGHGVVQGWVKHIGVFYWFAGGLMTKSRRLQIDKCNCNSCKTALRGNFF